VKKIDTLAVHAGEGVDPETGALRIPLHMSTTFKLPPFGIKLFEALLLDTTHPAYAYTRWGNPTLRALEERLVALETIADRQSSEKIDAVVTASGMAAISTFILTVLSAGDHLIANDVCYAGSVELFGLHLPRLGIEVSLVDTSDIQQVKATVKPNTRLIFVETPSNPILRISDISAIAQLAHQAGALLAVDSTWAGPSLQQPLALGADYVIHSLTKYLNGHGDSLGGVIIGPEEGIHRIRKEMLIHLGGVMSPFNAWLIMRSIATLPLRITKHCENASLVVSFLEGHPKVKRVVYPGLESHPHYELAKKQMSGFGGMLTFQLKHGLGTAINLAERVKVFSYATSLGHAHSLLFYYPTDIYFDSVPYLSNRQKLDIRDWTGDGIVRASIGLEHPNDLITDLDQALNARTFKGVFGAYLYRILRSRV
jgi:methionine-gamma-lyase